jgi:mannosyltransferase
MSLAGSWGPHYWRDERSTLSADRSGWGSLGSLLRHRDAVHGGYYALVHPWLRHVGSSPFVARFPSAVFIAVAVAFTTAIAGRIAGRRAAVLSGLVLALLPVSSHYGMELRSYALVCALAAGSSYMLVRAGEEDRARVWWIAYGVLLLATDLTFVYALLLGLGHTLSLILARRPAKVQFSIFCIAAILTTPLLRLASGQSGQVSWIGRVVVGNLLDAPLAWIISVPQTPVALSGTPDRLLAVDALLLGMVLWLLVVVAIYRSWRRTSTPGTPEPAETAETTPGAGVPVLHLALPWLLFPISLLAVASLIRPTFVERYVFFSAPAFALLVGWALARLGRRSLVVVATVLVVLAIPLWVADRVPDSKSGAPGTARIHPGSGSSRPERMR